MANQLTAQDAKNKLWELHQISLSRQPQTQEDASDLSESFRELIDNLNDVIRMSEGKESIYDLKDGELMMVN